MRRDTRRGEKGKIQVKKSFVLYQEVIDSFRNKSYITVIEKLSSHLDHVGIIFHYNIGRQDVINTNTEINYDMKLNKNYA